MKKLMMILATSIALPTFAADSILVGDYSLTKDKEGCAASIVIKQVDKCFEVEIDAKKMSMCRINKGPVTKKLKTLSGDNTETKAFKTVNTIKVGNVLTEYTTTSIKNKYYQTVTRSFETTTFTATKNKLYFSNSISKLALAPNGTSLRCQYTRVAE
jgi:hypothetical protein